MNGFMGIGMMNMNTGNVMGAATANAWQNTEGSKMDLSKEEAVEQPKAEPVVENSKWTCSCGAENEGKFCSECGKEKPAEEKVCKKCGTIYGRNQSRS